MVRQAQGVSNKILPQVPPLLPTTGHCMAKAVTGPKTPSAGTPS
jgi:hypothetical protein